MAEVNPPGFLQNAGNVHTAEITRNSVASALVGPTAATSLKNIGGIHPSLGNLFKVQQAGSPNMSVDVFNGIAYIPASEGSKQGTYVAVNDATVNKTIATSDPTNPRIDIVVLKVQDAFYSGVTNSWSIAVVTGTPAGSPSPPAAPANSMTIAHVAVAANATSIVNANITDKRYYATSLGGIVVCTSTTLPTWPTATAGIGQFAFETDTGTVRRWDGSGWLIFKETGSFGTVATSQTSASAAYTDLATVGPTASVVTNSGGRAKVTLSAGLQNSTGSASYMGVALSGATTVAPSDGLALEVPGFTTATWNIGTTLVYTGLGAGTTTFTAKYRSSSGTATFANRTIIVEHF